MFKIQATISSSPGKKSWISILPGIFLFISLSAIAETASLQFSIHDFSESHPEIQH